MKNALLRVCGVLLLSLGMLGVFLPILPTTPFVLVGSGCLGSASPRLLKRLEKRRYFGEFIRNYRQKSGISRKTRIIALCWLWGALSVSAIVAAKLQITLVLLVVGIAVSIHILTIAPAKRDK